MIISLLFFLACFICGLALTRLFKLEFSPVVEVLVSLVLGVTGVTLILFFLAWVVPFSRVSIAVETAGLVMMSVWRISRDRSFRLPKVLKSLKEAVVGLSLKGKLAAAFFITIVIWIFGRALFFDSNGQLWAGDRLVWTDWPLHIAMAANFAWGNNFPPQNPTFAGIPLIYPFFADFLSGVLMQLGESIPVAFAVPGVVLTLCFFGLFVVLGSQLLEKVRSPKEPRSFKFIAMGALLLSLFWGGLGWVYWLKEAFGNETTLVETLLSPPREYTFWWEKGQWFFTFLYSEILPQRAFLFGLPLFFLVLYLVYVAWEGRRLRCFTIAGTIGGLMPFFHTHSYFSLVILAVTMAAIGGIGILRSRSKGILKPIRQAQGPEFTEGQVQDDRRRRYLEAMFLFFLPFGILSLVQLPLFLPQNHGFPFHFGWMKEGENFFVYWFKNTGFFIPLFLLGLWKGRLGGFGRVLGIASLSLFILPNLFQFAPWGYDNLKIFTYWYLIGSVFVMAGLVRIWEMREIGWIGKIAAVFLFISLTLSGVVEVGRLVDTERVKVGLWPKDDFDFARQIREKTPSAAVFLTSAIHDHPVASLAGRKIILGFPGNSWSWGIEGWDERERNVHTMFKGGDEAKSLWQKYGIDYIVVSDRERYFEKDIDEEYIRENGTLILEKGNTRVYRIND